MMSPNIPSPKDFFGYQMGEDRKLARWDKLVEYYQTLSERSDKVKLVELGKTTEGNSFIMVVVSSPENISRIDEIKRIGPTLAHETLTELQLDRIVKEGKAVIAMAMSIHASEVGGTQMAPELVHDLITLQNPGIEVALNLCQNGIFGGWRFL